MIKSIKESIIIPAWNIIQSDIKIKKIYLLPWLLSTIFLTILLVYQAIYTYVELFWKKEEALIIILKFFESDYSFTIIVIVVIFLIIYFILTPIFEWWLIKYIKAKNSNKQLSYGEIFWEWLYNFLPIFEYNNIFSEFKIISILNGFLFTLRFLWIEYIVTISYIFIIVLLLWILLNILFTYSKYIMVLDNKWVFESIWLSSRITILNLRTTTKLYFFILLLNLRVILNFIIFLSFPIIMIIVVWFITSKLFLFVAITILSLLFISLILILSYLTAVLDVFKTSIWYYAYVEWKIKLEDK